MPEPYERLQEARRKAGFDTPTDAARAFGWSEITYRAHENGLRGIRNDVALRYAKAFKVPAEWLLYGIKPGQQAKSAELAYVPLIGYVGAGAQAYFTEAGVLGEVEAPPGSTESTVAVEIRGDSLGAFFDRWLVFYDDVRRPITPDLIGRLCVVGLADERVLIKKPVRSKARGLFHLLSQAEDPIMDVQIDWAAKVKSMVPR